jgi:hypothetical protein
MKTIATYKGENYNLEIKEDKFGPYIASGDGVVRFRTVSHAEDWCEGFITATTRFNDAINAFYGN